MADKKLFELTLGTPTDTDLIAFGKTGSSYKNISVANFRTIMQGTTAAHKTLTVEIGPWNMDTLQVKSVAFILPPVPPAIISLTPVPKNKIRSVNVIIRDDTDATYSDFVSVQNGTAYPNPQLQILTFNYIFESTRLFMYRRAGSTYDAANYSKTTNPDTSPYNRGWVTITYVD